VEQLGGMQAQEPRPPFLGLWSRLRSFRDDDLRSRLRDGTIVRGPFFRATLHLLSARDFAAFRVPLQPALDRAFGVVGARANTLDIPAILEQARSLLSERPRTFNELRPLLFKAFPTADESALGYAVRTMLPLTMVSTEDRFGFPRDSAFALAEPDATEGAVRELLRRYLAAFGPASAADAQAWSGLPRLGGTFEAMRDELVAFTDERGRELFDLPQAPRPPADTPAPVRFIPDFDNLLLAHADRTRVIADSHHKQLTTKNLRVNAVVLHDGELCALWKLKRAGHAARLEIVPFGSLPKRVHAEIEAEAAALLAYAEPDAARAEITFADPIPLAVIADRGIAATVRPSAAKPAAS
jgi:hypothetical protein